MCERGNEVVIETPDWLWNERNNPENGISIDSCIADQIRLAWQGGVRTLGSCCGHYEETPSVVLTQDVEQIELAKKILPDWDLFQWRLIQVN